jgi:hypothetical protein
VESLAQLSVIKEALAETQDALAAAPVTPLVRELRSRLAAYARVIAEWSYRPPTHAQRAAMLECVMEVHAQVAADVAKRRAQAATRTTRPPPNRARAQARSTKPPPRRGSVPPR